MHSRSGEDEVTPQQDQGIIELCRFIAEKTNYWDRREKFILKQARKKARLKKRRA